VHVTLENRDKKTAREKWYMVFMVCRSRMTKKMEAPLAARGWYTSLCSDKLFCTSSNTANEHQNKCFSDFANRICTKPHVIATFNATVFGYTWQLVCIGLNAVAPMIKLTEVQQN